MQNDPGETGRKRSDERWDEQIADIFCLLSTRLLAVTVIYITEAETFSTGVSGRPQSSAANAAKPAKAGCGWQTSQQGIGPR